MDEADDQQQARGRGQGRGQPPCRHQGDDPGGQVGDLRVGQDDDVVVDVEFVGVSGGVLDHALPVAPVSPVNTGLPAKAAPAR
jgi:hypothetical protein